MEFQKLSAPSLKELFIDDIEKKILSGQLPIGTKLPSERELAASMQVSRAVVNAGISELEKKGFLVVKPRVGTFVSDYRRYGTLETLSSIMRYNGGELGQNEVRSIIEIRSAVMQLSVDSIIESDHLKDAVPILERVSALTVESTTDEIVDTLFYMHHELAFISGNTILPLFFVSFKNIICSLLNKFVLVNGKEKAIEFNKLFMKYIVEGKKDEIIKLVDVDSHMK